MKNKILSLALSFTMIISAFSFAFAENAVIPENDAASDAPVQTEEQIPAEPVAGEENADAEEVLPEEELPAESEDTVITEEEKAIETEQENDITAESTGEEETSVPAVKSQKAETAVRIDKPVTAEPVEENAYNPETVNYTEAGPFMDPVYVGPMLMRSARSTYERPLNPDPDGNGLSLMKKAEAQPDGSYKITMESWTTGEVSSTEKSIPVDVVLVLDQSGSMNYNFEGSGKSKERQIAMKSSISKFIDNVAKRYSDKADHRISLVEFRSDATILKGWTNVDAKGATDLKNSVNSLNAEGATNVGAGMEQAEKLMGSKYNYTGSNMTRQKVVIVFTDGVPTTSNEFHTGVANTAIESAKNLKDSGCTVYSVGIFQGADPNQLHGPECNGSVGSSWSATSVLGFGDVYTVDIPAGNRFLNYLSSNYKDATEVGLVRRDLDMIFFRNVKFEITKNFERTAPATDEYYLTASNAQSLDKIFETIVENIQSPTIDLGTETTVRDVVTQYFDMPADTSAIKVYTADYDGTSFGERIPETSYDVSMTGRTVEVKGFDYNKNFVSDTAKTDGTFGKKLIIEFSVTAREKFLGGNRVPTNEDTSGVYDKAGICVDTFRLPRVDVPLKDYTAVAKDINIYLNGEVTRADVEGNSGTKFFTNREFIELLDWQTDYVDFEETSSGYVKDAKNDSTYKITGQLKPKMYGDVKDGPVVEATGKINVFKPEVTFKDITGYYGDTFPELETAYVGTVWKHGDVKDTDVSMTKPNMRKPVTFEYAYDNSLKSGKYINTANDIGVDVTSKMDTEDISAYTTFKHQPCNPDCGYTDANADEFLVHVKSCTLEITKNLTGGNPEKQTFILDVKGTTNLGERNLQFTVKPEADAAGVYKDKVVLKGLPVGTYSVKENGKWAWRYNIGYNPASVQLSSTTPDGSLVVNNAKKTDKWLGGFTAVENVFDKFVKEPM